MMPHVATLPSPSTGAFPSRENPVLATVLRRITLNGDADRQTLHVELSLDDSGLSYEPGDSIGVVPENDPALVRALIKAGGWQDSDPVTVEHGVRQLAEALGTDREISGLRRKLVSAWAERGGHDALKRIAAVEAEFESWGSGRGVLDLLDEHPIPDLGADELVRMLPALQPRLYSVASSPRMHPDEAHLTVGVVRYHAHGRLRQGVCSTQIADRVSEGEALPIYVHRNSRFRLPAPDVPIIMVAAGTGIAPFRAFVEERAATAATGRSWLFFGERHRSTDFFYEAEWERWLRYGVLSRLDLAFSRDDAERVYVQHRMRARGAELWAWLQEGAVLYVCGSARKMARDVHETLIDIAATQEGVSREDAQAVVAQLARERRYLRDVW